jgi:hypothetical protein
MVVHLTATLKMALGELPVSGEANGPFRFPVVKHLVIYVLPWPKGTPTAPELVSQPIGQWATDVGDLDAILHRFRDHDLSGPWPEHPAFGTLSGSTWGALMHRHVDHHFRQFGV